MTNTQIEKRFTAIEQGLARLEAQIAAAPPHRDNWVKAIAGTFANDLIFDEAMTLGRQWRESHRPKPTRRVPSRPRPARKAG